MIWLYYHKVYRDVLILDAVPIRWVPNDLMWQNEMWQTGISMSEWDCVRTEPKTSQYPCASVGVVGKDRTIRMCIKDRVWVLSRQYCKRLYQRTKHESGRWSNIELYATCYRRQTPHTVDLHPVVRLDFWETTVYLILNTRPILTEIWRSHLCLQSQLYFRAYRHTKSTWPLQSRFTEAVTCIQCTTATHTLKRQGLLEGVWEVWEGVHAARQRQKKKAGKE